MSMLECVPYRLAQYRALAAAVIRQAVADHQSNLARDGLDRALSSEAARWLLSDDSGPFRFAWLCDVLELRPDDLRRVMNMPALLHSVDRRLAIPPPRTPAGRHEVARSKAPDTAVAAKLKDQGDAELEHGEA